MRAKFVYNAHVGCHILLELDSTAEYCALQWMRSQAAENRKLTIVNFGGKDEDASILIGPDKNEQSSN